MSKHGLTRVAFRGDKTFIVAGAIPPHVAVRGLTEELTEATPVPKPGAAKSNIPKPPVPPARVPKGAVLPKNADTQEETK